MSITAIIPKVVDFATIVTVTSDLTSPFYHWYISGRYAGMTLANRKAFFLPPGSQGRVTCQDTVDQDYDPYANAPDGYPNFRTVHWIRAIATDVDHYKIEEQKDSGGWTQKALVGHEESRWYYTWESGILVDLSSYEWRITPVDTNRNAGTAISYTAEKIVRVPDAPDFKFLYNATTDKITFAEL